MIRAAGVMFATDNERVLWVQRSPVGDAPGLWAFPGGKIEEGETEEQAASREVNEEIGYRPEGVMFKLYVSPGEVEYTTFKQLVPSEFLVSLNEEHTGWAWASLTRPPQPLHPGVVAMLQNLGVLSFDEALALDTEEPLLFDDALRSPREPVQQGLATDEGPTMREVLRAVHALANRPVAQPPITVNVTLPDRGSTRKVITSKRDAAGVLVSEVVETPET